jgi:bifunctional non-homologous end joining protein LigD
MPTETVTLYFREGSSDKVYTANIEETPGGFLVTFAYGRRGSAFQTGTKTTTPVPYNQAKKIFDRLVDKKMAKRYKPGENNTAYLNTAREERDTGLRPQLLNAIEEPEAIALLSNPDYWMQEKHNGRRSLVKKHGTEIIATNRMGLSIAILDTVLHSAQAVTRDFTIDGELMSDNLLAFDLLSLDGYPSTGLPYSTRLEQLHLTLKASKHGILVIPTAKTTHDKKTLYAQLRKDNKEGVVFKKYDAPYTPGKPHSGGDQLKYKFYAMCSAIAATGRTGKRSIALELFDGHQIIQVGNVTVPANQKIPQPGQIVEIRYLYAYPGGSLYQPILLDIRDDIEKDACNIRQIKFKTPIENDDDL